MADSRRRPRASPDRVTTGDRERPLSARSIIASTLMGSHPPKLAGRLLVALAEQFGVAEGTTRVALSRMVDKRELTNDDGTYELAGHLLERQRRQDQSLVASSRPWDHRWHQALAVGPADAAHRASRRTSLRALKMGELRDGVWLRPANLDPGRLRGESAWTTEDLLWGFTSFEQDDAALARQLWDLPAWAAGAQVLGERHDAMIDELATGFGGLVPGFELSAATLRHFVADPDLPAKVLPADWPGSRLRATYGKFDIAYRGALRRFFRAHR